MPGWLDSLFSSRRRQDTETASQQQAQSQFGLTPQVLDYWQSISGQFGPQNWTPVGADPYQTASAQAQAGYASGLTPAFGAATGIAQNGISTADINRFMSPYTQNVVDATRQNFADQNAQDNTINQAQAAKLGALSGTNPIVARQLATERQRSAQDPVIAGLYEKGYQQAADMAARSAQTQLGGVGAASGVAGQQAGINQGQFGMGSQFWNQNWQNQNQPLNWATQGAQTLASLIPGSGQTSSGSATGTGTTTQTSTPSPFDMYRTLGGLGLQAASLFIPSDERIKDNIKEIGETHDGQPIYKFNYKGSPVTTIGLMAQDVEGRDPGAVGSVSGLKTVDYDRATKGAERRMAGGGAVSAPSDPHEKFVKAFDTISGLISRSKGGSVMKPYADGGPIGSWATTIEPASSGFSMEKLGKFGKDLQNMGTLSKGGDGDLGVNSALASTQANLSNLIGSMRPRFDDGGAVEWGERGPAYPETASGLSPMFAGVARSDLAPVGSLDRSSFAGQLEDPKTRSALLALAHAEVGGQGPEAQQAFLETVFNRAAARGKSLSDTIYDRGYYPSMTYDRMGGAIPEARYTPILDKVMGGSNVAKYATGNASGTVGFNGGPETAAFRGERFGIEGPDRKWANASGALPNMGAAPEGARLAASISRPVDVAPSRPGVMTASARSPDAVVAAAPERKDTWYERLLPGLKEGIWAGKPATNLQRLGAALMAGGPGDGIAQNIMAWEATRQKEREIDNRVSELMGSINGQPTLAARQLAQQTADAAAQRKQAADIALGRINGQPTLARETHALNAQKVPIEIAAQQTQTAMNRAKLEQPELMTPAERAQVANEYGLEAGTPEHDFFVLNGTMPQKTISSDTIKEVNGKLVRVPSKGAAEMIFDAGPDFSKLPEFAAKSAGFASRMIDAEQNVRGVMGDRGLKASQALNNLPTGTGAQIITQLKAAGFTDEDIASSGLGALLQTKPTFTRDEIAAHLNKNKFDPTSAAAAVANWLPEGAANYFVRTEDQQRYAQAAEQWIRAFLRKESGAAIGKDEFARDFKVYFPQPGDTAETVRQKAQARLNAVRGFTEESRGYFDHAHGEQKALLNEWLTGKTQGRLKPEAEISRPIPRIASDADYEALPSGATFIDPNGNKRIKP